MNRNRQVYDRLFLLGRLPVVLLGVFMGWLVWRWSRELYGPRAGLVSLAGFAFCPTLVAHSHLATIDAGAAAFILLALYTFERFVSEPSPGRLALSGVALGLAQIAKLTSLFSLPHHPPARRPGPDSRGPLRDAAWEPAAPAGEPGRTAGDPELERGRDQCWLSLPR